MKTNKHRFLLLILLPLLALPAFSQSRQANRSSSRSDSSTQNSTDSSSQRSTPPPARTEPRSTPPARSETRPASKSTEARPSTQSTDTSRRQQPVATRTQTGTSTDQKQNTIRNRGPQLPPRTDTQAQRPTNTRTSQTTPPTSNTGTRTYTPPPRTSPRNPNLKPLPPLTPQRPPSVRPAPTPRPSVYRPPAPPPSYRPYPPKPPYYYNPYIARRPLPAYPYYRPYNPYYYPTYRYNRSNLLFDIFVGVPLSFARASLYTKYLSVSIAAPYTYSYRPYYYSPVYPFVYPCTIYTQSIFIDGSSSTDTTPNYVNVATPVSTTGTSSTAPIDIPDGYTYLVFNNTTYLLKNGQFFLIENDTLHWTQPPYGALTQTLPEGSTRIIYQNFEYYEYDNIYFRTTPGRAYQLISKAPWSQR